MADGGPRLVADYQSPLSLPIHPSQRGHYLAQPQDNSYSRRKPPVATLSIFNTPNANMSSSSASPPNVKNAFGGVGTAIAYGGPPPSIPVGPQPGDRTNPLNISLIKNLTDKRVTRDGQPPKRRGPKPDSKPAMSRRQELNRQAQRTHRERKEMYIKALEDEVMRLKDVFSNVSRDKVRLAEENRMLRDVIQQNGLGGLMSFPVQADPARPGMMEDASGTMYPLGPNLSPSNTSTSYALHSATTQTTGHPFSPPSASAHSASGAATMPRGLTPQGPSSNGLSPYSTASSSLPYQRSSPVGPSPSQQQMMPQRLPPPQQQRQQDPGFDYEQAGIDFVLALEKPCMDHMPWLLERSAANGGKDPCGHALMASCPPEPYSALTNDIPFGHRYGDENRNGNGVGATGGYVQQQQPQQLIRQQQQQQTTANSSVGMSRNNNTATNKVISSSSAMDVDGADASAPRTWELSKADLATLLDLSQKLNLDGEITPVMAWGMVLGHPRLGELGAKEIAGLAEDLTGKVRCYGFGAVMEEFEVRDALEAVFSRKPEPSGMGGRF